MILNNQIVSLDDAFARFMNALPDEKDMLIIQSGRQVIHDQIIQVMDRAKRAGVRKIGFAMIAR